MNNHGFVKLHRQILDWEWYSDINVKCLFIHCLLKANHKEKRWRGAVVKRGSFITSYPILAQELGLSQRQIRYAISKLKLTGELSVKTTNKNTMLTLCNYDSYHILIDEDVSQIVTQSVSDVASTCKSSVSPVSPTKNDKNDKNEKNNKKTNAKKADAFVLPEWVNVDAWNSFKEMRNKVKKPLTPRASKMAINKLQKLKENGNDPIAVLEQSVFNCWTDLYEIKKDGMNFCKSKIAFNSNQSQEARIFDQSQRPTIDF